MITCPCCTHSFEPDAQAALGLTGRQRKLLVFIKGYLAENDGVAPTFNEMKDFLGLASKTAIHHLINELDERGAIRRIRGKTRAISIVGGSA
ncbi:LexA family protein [Neorhizobium tomejilense]|uniref:LexA family protein n=1 Tax=Neorhizobium tomejilense TaxID=2093828 RepID=UPI000CF859EB|nr:hypothetical protein [Neorhizobium tomejilense]